jgi:hypothetical protein
MNERGKSDGPVVPANPPNKAAAAEAGEERGLAKGSLLATPYWFALCSTCSLSGRTSCRGVVRRLRTGGRTPPIRPGR